MMSFEMHLPRHNHHELKVWLWTGGNVYYGRSHKAWDELKLLCVLLKHIAYGIYANISLFISYSRSDGGSAPRDDLYTALNVSGDQDN